MKKVADDGYDQKKGELLANRQLDPFDDAIIGVLHGVLKSECSEGCVGVGLAVLQRWCWGELEVVPDDWWGESSLPAHLPRVSVTSGAKMAGGIADVDPCQGEKLVDRFWNEDNTTVMSN